ncbi:hypothetical protein OZ429_18345 [Xanthomonas fragariae]|nr:hypothetical protein [Xanthomonas fragariae]WAT14858.1 hypothetical protein OZ429_18345 [Xanthomonas fragariae]
MIEGMAWLPWIVLFPATLLLWRDRTRTVGLWTIGIGYALASLVGQISAPAVFALASLLAAGWAVRRGRSRWLRAAGHVLFVLTALALQRHIVPGFNNPPALVGVVSAGAMPYKAYLNLDKTLGAVWVVVAIAWLDTAGPTLRRLGAGALIGAVTFALLAALALGAGVVRVEPKIPAITWLWALNNILLVCFAEEVIFRGYVQGGLARLLAGRLRRRLDRDRGGGIAVWRLALGSGSGHAVAEHHRRHRLRHRLSARRRAGRDRRPCHRQS